MTKTCMGDNGGTNPDCPEGAGWVVQNEVTGVELGACDSHIAQVSQVLADEHPGHHLSVYLKAGV